MKTYSYNGFLIILIGLLYHCTNTTNNHSLNEQDTAILVQTILADRLLESELIKTFGKQQFKLVEGPSTKLNQKFMFSGTPVKIVPSTGDFYQIHEQHPRELYVSVPQVKFFSKDSASVLLIFHAGNATALFNLKNDKEEWIIKGRQNGKF